MHEMITNSIEVKTIILNYAKKGIVITL